jgi:inner membrane transporter RhtA
VSSEDTGRGIPALEPVPPIVLVVAAITSIQFGAALAATLFDRVGPAGVSAVRLTLAALVLLAIWRPWRKRRTAEALRAAALFGVVLGAMNLTFFLAVDRIPLGVAVTIEFLGPIAVGAIYSARRRDLVWPAIALLGVVLLAEPWDTSGGLDTVGMALAAVAAVFWGVYIVVAERASRLFDGGEGLSIALVFAAFISLVPGVAEAGSDLLDPELLAIGLAVSLLSTVIPYSLETEALRRIPRGVFGVLMSLEPAVAALAGLLILGEHLAAVQLAAIALVVVASVGVTRSSSALDAPSATMDA